MKFQRISYSVTFLVLLSLNAYSKDRESFEEDIAPSSSISNHRSRRAAANSKILLWLNATIPYEVDPRFNDTEKNILLGIIHEWISDTCLRFVKKTGSEPYSIYFFKTSGQYCFSKTGVQWQEPMPQLVHVNPRCLTEVRGTMSHELGHLLGFFHEHNRPDRDRYIKIIWENVRKNSEHQFQKKTEDEVFSFGSPYDFDSIMQYPLDYCSIRRGLPTMQLRVKYDKPVGERMSPSQKDKQQLKYLYGCEPYIPPSSGSGSGDSENFVFLDLDFTSSETYISPETSTIEQIKPSSSIDTHKTSSPTDPTKSSDVPDRSAVMPIQATPLPGHSQVLQSGQLIGLKAQLSSEMERHYWFTCGSKRCNLKRCPGRNFNKKKQSECISSMFMLLKQTGLNDDDPVIYVGNQVLLMPNNSTKALIACGPKGICKIKHGCFYTDWLFRPFCSEHLLRLYVPGKLVGTKVMNSDLIELRHNNTLVNRPDSWLGCDPLGTKKCKRYYCSKLKDGSSECDYERFQVCVL